VFGLRFMLEAGVEAASPDTIFVGRDRAVRLPNTSLFITPGWRGATQVMALDLAGFAISAGSACSSGKIAASSALAAMGYDDAVAACAVRVSLGAQTSRADIIRFIQTWTATYKRHAARAA